jgi:hypothetical protein
MSKENNQNQMNEMQEAIKLRQDWTTGVGYSAETGQNTDDIMKANERLLIEDVDFTTAPVSVLEQKIKEFNELRKIVYQEYDTGLITQEQFELGLDCSKQAIDYFYNVIQNRANFASYEPERWKELMLILHIDYSNCQSSLEKTQLLRQVLEKRHELDEQIQEFNGHLALLDLREKLISQENDDNSSKTNFKL